MKPAHRTISYVVYPPNYEPKNGNYVREKTLRDAESRCRKKGFGPGSEVVRNFSTGNRRGGGFWSDPREWVFNGDRK